MIEHVYRRAAEARGIDAVVVATDDQRIADAVEHFGGVARMTSASHRTGTDRIAEVARELHCSVIVNVQGDEPLVAAASIAQMVDALQADATLEMTTLRTPIRREEDYASPHVVKVVVDANDNALYFSRSPIPSHREGPPTGGHYGYKHLGLYAYRREFLLRLAALPQTALERAESLEQLRALEHGHRIRAVETQYDSIGVDTPEDLDGVRERLGFRLKAEATRV
jgi:3-deoxy-manno-octulosonate cytidylyltransferase (CMP-KDO synthetase)